MGIYTDEGFKNKSTTKKLLNHGGYTIEQLIFKRLFR